VTRALKGLRRRHEKAERTYSLIASLLHSKLKAIARAKRVRSARRTGKGVQVKVRSDRDVVLARGRRRRRLAIASERERDLVSVARCKEMAGAFEVCLVYDLGWSLTVNARERVCEGEEEFVMDLTLAESAKERVCSAVLDGLPFAMCVDLESVWFERMGEEGLDVRGGYSFRVKESVDGRFERVRFVIGGDAQWDVKERVRDVTRATEWTRKCNVSALRIATLCVDEFGDGRMQVVLMFRAVVEQLQKELLLH